MQEPRRIEDPLLHAAESVPDKTALVDGGDRQDYADLLAHARSVAGQLVRAGVEPGERVSVFLDRTAECVAAIYGSWMAGAVVVPVHEGLRDRQVRHILTHSGSRALISGPKKLRVLDEQTTRDVTVLEPDPAPSGGKLPEGLEGGRTPAAILYTSGSTGLPKGILISHDNLLAGARIVARYLEIAADERILAVLPFSFDYGLNQLLTAVGRRATLVLQRSAMPADICRTLERERITALAAVPPLWIQLAGNLSPFTKTSFPHLRYITNSGGVFPVETIRVYRAHVPHTRIYLMYGLSEAFRSTYLPPEQIDRRPTSMGRAIPECEVFPVDERGVPCPPGQTGELVHRGPTISLGYWNDPETTARVFRPDPERPQDPEARVVYSGDLVKTDDDGFLYFVGRRDEMIKSHGFRISPGEVESAVFESGLVREVVVRGEPDPVAGAAVVVHCVPVDPASFTPRQLEDFCRREMPRYMLPRQIHVHEAFPRTPSGKIDRKAVRS